MGKLGCLFFVGVIGFVAYLTNPSKQRHLENAYSIMNQRGLDFMGEDSSALNFIEDFVGKERMAEFLAPFIRVKNYVVFSVTQISIAGEEQTIAIGAFGMFWDSDSASRGESFRDRFQDFLENGVGE